jgi:hypothetical protein
MKPTKTGGPTEMRGDAEVKGLVPGYESTLSKWMLERFASPTDRR